MLFCHKWYEWTATVGPFLAKANLLCYEASILPIRQSHAFKQFRQWRVDGRGVCAATAEHVSLPELAICRLEVVRLAISWLGLASIGRCHGIAVLVRFVNTAHHKMTAVNRTAVLRKHRSMFTAVPESWRGYGRINSRKTDFPRRCLPTQLVVNLRCLRRFETTPTA